MKTISTYYLYKSYKKHLMRIGILMSNGTEEI